MWINIEFTNIIWLSGVSKVSFRGGGGVGFKLICEKWAYLHARGFGGMLPREIFLKWCNLMRSGMYFATIL